MPTIATKIDGKRIKAIRQALRMTQENFSHKIGVTYATVNRWENDKSEPNEMATRTLLRLEKKHIRSGQ